MCWLLRKLGWGVEEVIVVVLSETEIYGLLVIGTGMGEDWSVFVDIRRCDRTMFRILCTDQLILRPILIETWSILRLGSDIPKDLTGLVLVRFVYRCSLLICIVPIIETRIGNVVIIFNVVVVAFQIEPRLQLLSPPRIALF